MLFRSNDLSQRNIYYETLTPVKLRSLLKGTKPEGTKNIDLRKFPLDNNKKIDIFYNFYNDCKKQGSVRDGQIISVDKVNEITEITTVSSSFFSCVKTPDELFNSLFDKELYLYATIKGSGIPHPIDYFGTIEKLEENRSVKVLVDNIVYYNSILLIREKDILRIVIGNSLTYILSSESTHGKIEIKVAQGLRGKVKDMAFIISAISAQYIMIDGVKFDFPITSDQIDIDQMRKELTYLQPIILTLNDLHVKNDLDTNKLTQKEWRELDSLVSIFGKRNTSVAISNNNANKIIKKYSIAIQNINIRLYGIEYGEETIFYDFINSNNVTLSPNIKSNKKTHSTIYSNLSVDDYIKLSNINYEMMLSSYQRVLETSNLCYSQVNQDVLNLIMAYDKTDNPEQIKAAKELIEWLFTKSTGFSQEILIVNSLQIYKRERDLFAEEKEKLIEIGAENTDLNVKVAAYLLLDNQDMAKYYFKKLECEKQNTFKMWPIYRFWKD